MDYLLNHFGLVELESATIFLVHLTYDCSINQVVLFLFRYFLSSHWKIAISISIVRILKLDVFPCDCQFHQAFAALEKIGKIKEFFEFILAINGSTIREIRTEQIECLRIDFEL